MTTVSRAPPLPPPPHNRPGSLAPVYEDIEEWQSSSGAGPASSLTGPTPSSAGPTPSPASHTTDPAPLGTEYQYTQCPAYVAVKINRKGGRDDTSCCHDTTIQVIDIHYI